MKEKICPQCKKVFKPKDPRNTFCSHECAYEYRRTIPGKNIEKLRLYRIWSHMIRRCYKQKSNDYKNYGARGIIICDDWKNSFLNFYDWSMCNGYNDTLSIDRIDVNGNYEPDNCRWVTSKIQGNNKRNSVVIEYNGEKHTIAQWVEITKIPYHIIWNRFKKGWNSKAIFETPLTKRKQMNTEKITFNGKCLSRVDWDKELGFVRGTVGRRLQFGWTIEKALTTPIDSKYNTRGKKHV